MPRRSSLAVWIGVFCGFGATAELSRAQPGGSATAPIISVQPASIAVFKDDSVVLRVTANGNPTPIYSWAKDGEIIAGQTSAMLTLSRTQPIDAGIYTVNLFNPAGTVTSQGARVSVVAALGRKSVARWWNEALLDGIRRDTPNPPVHARNLFHLSAVLWDAFWAYERGGWAARREVFVKENPELPADEANRIAAQQQAMSYAAYTLIERRFTRSPGAGATLVGLRWLMQQYGYDPDFRDATGGAPAAIGLRIAERELALTLTDGANEANGYADATGYRPVNPPLIVRFSGVGMIVDPGRWQPLDLVNIVTQNGIVLGGGTQPFVGANAIRTQTFALPKAPSGFLTEDPGPPPRFGSADYVSQAVAVIGYSAQLTADDGATIDISPGSLLNNPIGTNSGRGHAINPVTGERYPSNVVLRGDYARVLAEFWADGPSSETPPGHWNVLFNQVSDHPLSTRQFLGQGRPLRRLEWDVAGYLALNGALHDAACAAWTLKWQYDSARPITIIRHLAELGQATEPSSINYNPAGLPLVPGLIELITAASAAPGQRHAHLAGATGRTAVKAWLGTPASALETSGVGWMLGVEWRPYQRETFVTPAFPGYVSGHSAFSRAAAEVIARLTGSEFFPGGLATYDFAAGTALGFEAGPKRALQLQWATYFDAADQAGLSRLYGGIHVSADDLTGRKLGAKVGRDALDRFMNYHLTPAVATVAPTFLAQPASITTASGRTAVFTIEVSGSGPFTYEWRRGGTVVGTAGSLTLNGVSATDAGDYTVVVSNSLGVTTSQSARLTIDGSPVLANLSTRAPVGVGERALIAGFVVRGSTTKQVVVRGIGPALTPLGVPGALPNPTLTLYDGANRVIASNDDWNASTTPASMFNRLGAFPFADKSADAALVAALAPGSYTVVLGDATNRTGIGLVEIYEADSTTNRLMNLSSRAFVGPGENIGIAGFVVRGQKPARYLIRGVGPALAAFGVKETLADPVLTLTTDQGAVVATNDNWSTNANAADLAAVATQVGAFALPTAARDAALLVTLSPGNYTALVSGVDGTSGVALVEIFDVP